MWEWMSESLLEQNKIVYILTDAGENSNSPSSGEFRFVSFQCWLVASYRIPSHEFIHQSEAMIIHIIQITTPGAHPRGNTSHHQ